MQRNLSRHEFQGSTLFRFSSDPIALHDKFTEPAKACRTPQAAQTPKALCFEFSKHAEIAIRRTGE